jgi:hypothetical protein
VTQPARKPLARRGNTKQIPVAEAKEKVLDGLANGLTREAAMRTVDRSLETYRSWVKDDAEFKATASALMSARQSQADAGAAREPVPDFATFCRDYLHEPLFPHQLRWVDILEGREPREMHGSMVYEPGDSGRLLINVPPNFAKTVTLSTNYVVWRIHKDPNVKIAIVSKSKGFAKKILAAIKMRLTSNAYREMHLKFAPDGGWKDPDQSWTQDLIYVQGKGDGEKDPTVEAVGMGGQIYGGRFDIIICDDVLDNDNHHHHEEQVEWVTTILDTRLPPEGGLLIVVGTRMAPTDLYSELRKAVDEEDEQFWTYFSQPAVLEYGDQGKDGWLSLWPWTDWRGSEKVPHEPRCTNCYASPGDCVCGSPNHIECQPRWPGAKLAKKRFPMGERRWSLVYQQQQIPDDATFNQRAVEAAINRMRKPGVMDGGGVGHRQSGTSGLYVVGGLDPATVGHTAMVVSGLDRVVGKRWVLDGYNKAGTSPHTLRETVKRLTDQHRINEWVIERNAFQGFLTQDPELNAFLRSRGCKLTPHYTTGAKNDPDFGVMGMSPLFESCGRPPENGGAGMWVRTPDTALMELPSDQQASWVQEMVKQLIMWEPSGLSKIQKTDLVMALWFTEIAFQRILGYGKNKTTHLTNRFASRHALAGRGSYSVLDLKYASSADLPT